MRKAKSTHTTFYKGAKIRVILRNGDVIVAKFIEKIGQKYLRTDKGDIPIAELRSATYYKPLPHERP
ncbi:MAG TPA: hypothetical protein VED01_06510 [Burkholderiales bacterium]|nr:hypothetical protein [Burkholderiales bacterium]